VQTSCRLAHACPHRWSADHADEDVTSLLRLCLEELRALRTLLQATPPRLAAYTVTLCLPLDTTPALGHHCYLSERCTACLRRLGRDTSRANSRSGLISGRKIYLAQHLALSSCYLLHRCGPSPHRICLDSCLFSRTPLSSIDATTSLFLPHRACRLPPFIHGAFTPPALTAHLVGQTYISCLHPSTSC